ncbi:MAG TPA: Phenylacetic acid catabolic protein [Chloroflexota bacterium]
MTESTTVPAALAKLIAHLADNKYFLGRRYAEWCTAAPTLESAVAAAAMAQDEIGHARSLYPLLRDIAGPSPEIEPETRTEFQNAAFLGVPFAGWTDFVAANLLFDTALTVLLDAARNSSSKGLAQRARRILEEEPLHWLHGEGWTRRLAGEGPAVREALTVSFRVVETDSLALLTLAQPELVETGVLDAESRMLCDRYRGRIDPVLAGAGMTIC